MKTVIAPSRAEMGRHVAKLAAAKIQNAIVQRGVARIIVATGSSQFEVLEALVGQPDIDWSKVTGFHLDEYIGIGRDHKASFCGYLKERFVDRVPLADFHYLPGDQDPEETIARVGGLLTQSPIDVAMVGIGENGHLAFNDPPADFETDQPYLIVRLDEPCRMQQVGEGWFKDLAEVPTHAISMSVRQIMKTASIFCSVPDERKAEAIRRTLVDPISPDVPASMLRNHADVLLAIDESAASKLNPAIRQSAESIA